MKDLFKIDSKSIGNSFSGNNQAASLAALVTAA